MSASPGSTSILTGLRSFASTERFLAELASDRRRPGYVLLGSEAYFCLHDLDLGQTSIFEALDLAQTPSLMAPFQLLLLRNVKTLYGRGQKKEEFAALDQYFRSPNPQALLLFLADHITLPQDVRRMDMTDKERAEKIRETLGDLCGIVELQQVSDDDATQWVLRTTQARGIAFTPDAARELVDALSADMLTMAGEVEKLILYAEAMQRKTVELTDVETMVAAAKQRSLYELTDAITLRDAPRALALLSGMLNASEGGEDAAIGHVFSLAKTYRQMLILNEKQVRDQRVAPFAADALIAQARRVRDRSELTRGLRQIAQADLELRSGPADKRLVLERLVLRLAGATEPETAHE
jgi:DNA polymerase-3 subunit delta